MRVYIHVYTHVCTHIHACLAYQSAQPTNSLNWAYKCGLTSGSVSMAWLSAYVHVCAYVYMCVKTHRTEHAGSRNVQWSGHLYMREYVCVCVYVYVYVCKVCMYECIFWKIRAPPYAKKNFKGLLVLVLFIHVEMFGMDRRTHTPLAKGMSWCLSLLICVLSYTL